MAQPKITIRFRFIRIPVTWEPFESEKTGLSLCGKLTKWDSAYEVKVSELDAWDCRKEFFGLPQNNVARLVMFLNKVGVWSESGYDPSQTVMSTGVEDVWNFRERLRHGLASPKHFRAGAAANLKPPANLVELSLQRQWEFPFRFEMNKAAVGVVTMTNFRDALWATVFADIAAGLKFKPCKRKDCQQLFPIESKHDRDYCSQYCGHLVSQRRNRAQRRRKKKALQKKSTRL